MLLQVSFDVRSPKAGYVEEILVEDGDTVEIGAKLINMKEGEAPEGTPRSGRRRGCRSLWVLRQ